MVFVRDLETIAIPLFLGGLSLIPIILYPLLHKTYGNLAARLGYWIPSSCFLSYLLISSIMIEDNEFSQIFLITLLATIIPLLVVYYFSVINRSNQSNSKGH